MVDLDKGIEMTDVSVYNLLINSHYFYLIRYNQIVELLLEMKAIVFIKSYQLRWRERERVKRGRGRNS